MPKFGGGDEITHVGDSGRKLLRVILDGHDVQPSIEGTTNFAAGSKSANDNPLLGLVY
jgi:hypothetical protein